MERKCSLGSSLGCALYAVRIWKGDVLVAVVEELEEMDASDIHAKRNGKNFWRRSGTEIIHFWYGTNQFEENVIMIFWDNQKGLHLHNIFKTHIRMPLKHGMIYGPFRETSYTTITANKSQTLHTEGRIISYSTEIKLTSTGLLIQSWMYCRKAETMIIGTSMGQEVCLIHGQVSHQLLD